MSGHPAVQQALRNAHFDSLGLPRFMFPPKHNLVEPPWYGPVCPVVWEGRRCEASPYPDLEGWNAEHPLRAIRFRNVRPADRRRAIAAGFDAFEKVQQVGLQVRFIILRRDAVDARSAILAG